ncbi:hypothetical protein C5748_09730 [Phyllobacterium phragmitis]|uniref:Uncharacterized protein n=1 Tax=Phyllobacterium phragmitis TaxID=2670329 RepID=A0A2S9ISP7_9HYPH|nr:hypothetical protein [Phyllobacterium phragmitis]PRD43542.1 hypothetical protein C5748_09730 [Phyllobacterium phragmitis]
MFDMPVSAEAVRNAVVAACIAPFLVACSDSVPEATDQQLLEIIGSSSSFLGSDSPLSIPRSAVECVRVLSGLDADIYKDMPAEMLGAFKTGCRQEFAERLKDESRNPLGFTLESFENKDLAERITKLKETSDEANRVAAEEKREREKAESLAQAEAELEAARAEYRSFVASIDDRVSTAAPLCDEWLLNQASAKEKARNSVWAYRSAPEICKEATITQIRALAGKHLETLVNQTIKANSLFGFNKPYYGNASGEWFDQQMERLNADIAGMKAEIAG